MGCSLDNFKVGKWEQTTVKGHSVEYAPASSVFGRLKGVVYKLDGQFQGFTGSRDAALYHVGQRLAKNVPAKKTPKYKLVWFGDMCKVLGPNDSKVCRVQTGTGANYFKTRASLESTAHATLGWTLKKFDVIHAYRTRVSLRAWEEAA